MHNAFRSLLLAFSIWMPGTAVLAQELNRLGTLQLSGDIAKQKQLSGVTFFGKLMIVCPDEGTSFNVLKSTADSQYAVVSTINLLEADDTEVANQGHAELDLEGASSDDKYVYLIGSHALARGKVKEESPYEENRESVRQIKEHIGADSLFRLQLDDDGSIEHRKRISLSSLLKSDKILGRFCGIPSKENGIDIEGIAVKDGKLFIGFRGPVLRGNFVPVLVLKFKEPQDYELRFVNLEGHGIRDMTAVDDGFLLISGPVGDRHERCELYFWNGKDCIPGQSSPGGKARRLATLPGESKAKYEGLAVTNQSDTAWEIVAIREGETIGDRFRVPKP